ncbi:uncharacterized protein LOC141714300 [Apium graveolens]|uniref:uncharacterized protein LOC141714300 n=1 Tax=Apium graveolens TaxID=4045 RepID=UPI003D7ACACF
MSKAYDRIEWDFLKSMLKKVGFSDWWIYLIIQSVSTVFYSILHGEYELGPIIPTRGIRQVDPLSPYLFIICAESLTALINNYERKHWLHGIKVCRRALVISHMLFADDVYFYCKADVQEAFKVLQLLEIYEAASGQQAKSLVAEGVRWRVGSGVNINILNQPWLPDDHHPYVSTVSQTLENKCVNSLMKIGIKEWDLDIIKDVFNNRDQKLISDIDLQESGDKDMLYWKHENSGLYSVKSAYRWIKFNKGRWCIEDKTSIWAKLWSIKALPKTLNMIKRVQIEALCPVCHVDSETILHSLVTCEFAQRCWDILGIDIQCFKLTDFVDWLTEVLSTCNLKKQAECITLCWALWRARNDLVWNQRSSTVNRTVAAVKQYLTQWSLSQGKSSSMASLQPIVKGDGAETWVKPNPHSVKVSVDAAVFDDKEAVGFGLVARDSDNNLIQARTRIHNRHTIPVLAESMAIKEALSWIDEM